MHQCRQWGGAMASIADTTDRDQETRIPIGYAMLIWVLGGAVGWGLVAVAVMAIL